jgi:hypothetical protein
MGRAHADEGVLGRFGIGLRTTSLAVADEANPDNKFGLGGGGLHVRFRLTERWGLELSSEEVSGETKDGHFKRTANPVTLSAAYHLTPKRPWDFYLLLGVGTTAEKVQIGEREQVFEESHVHLGAGLEHRFGSFGIGVELRAVGLSMNPDEGDAKRYRDFITGPIPADSSGSQLNLVATYYL